jgi:hypothetical protein
MMKHQVTTNLAARLDRLIPGITTRGAAGRCAARLTLIVALIAGGTSASAATVYVNAAAAAGGNGTSWASAYNDLHVALTGRLSGDQIWVAQGTYSTVSQIDTFQLVTGVSLYGGFAGTETTLAQRNLFPELTILSGVYAGGNSYHVVTGADNSYIDGFTITGGVASVSSYPNGYAGGLWTYEAGTSVAHCVFLNNSATWAGGAVMCGGGATPSTFTDCVFSGNTGGGTRLGGGAVVAFTNLPTFINCVFTNNTASPVGTPTTQLGGGAIFLYGTTGGSLINCTFSGNVSANQGSAIYFFGSACTLSTTNCVFWGNTSVPSLMAASGVTATITASDCMFQEASLATGITLASGSIANRMGVNPLFINAGSPAGADGLFGTPDDGLRLSSGSPAISAGTSNSSSTSDLLGLPRPSANGLGFDIGAYQSQPVIYVTPTGTGNGGTWATASSLKGALAAYQAGNAQQIWVAGGTYRTLSQSDSFQLATGMQLYGGFAGNETQLSQRSWTANPTILSGNYGGGNSLHVVYGANNAVIDGFTITGGNASSGSYPDGYGGGMWSYLLTATISHCVFTGNSASVGGGAVMLGSPGASTADLATITDCVFSNNSSTGATYGGGAVIGFRSIANFSNCVFVGNTANNAALPVGGGALFGYNILAAGGSATNCTFYGNSAAANSGGATYFDTASTFSMTNSLFWANVAASGTTASGTSVAVSSAAALTLTANNCMFQEATLATGVTLSGAQNFFATSPTFVQPSNPAGPDGVFGTSDDGLALAAGSSGIDAGTAAGAPTADITLTPRPLGAGYDIGAYEYVPPILYVTSGGSGAGVSWSNPASLGHALQVAIPGEQIWVKQGTYALTSVTSTFQLVANVPVYGGFLGTETALSQRNVTANQTILNGAFSGGNAYHVVTAVDNATIDGFTIENGNATAAPAAYGGGLYALGFAPTVRHCIFLNNSALLGGGAMILANDAVVPALDQCYFANNTATGGGGGAYFYAINPPPAGITNCVFANNTCGNASSSANGGALILGGNTVVPSLVNCTVTGNTSTGPSSNAGGVYVFGGITNTPGQFTNCIFSNNNSTAAPISVALSSAAPTSTNCLYQEATLPAGLNNGGGNLLAANPGFANAGSLAGPDGIYGTADDGLALTAGGQAVDSGTASGAPLIDIIGTGRPQGAGFDMGAYELPTVIYASPSGAGSQNGTSWANAATLKHALAIAVNGSQIWAQQGTYTTSSLTDSFLLVSGAPLYGGFLGTETALAQRHRLLNPTILSGNYGSGNSYHVVIGADNATLDGFTITGGNASVITPGANSYGGGLFAFNATMTVSGCTFTGNSAALGGGGAYISASTAFVPLSIFDCYFVNNTCTSNTSTFGGGGLLISSGNRTSFPGAVTNCVFASNSTASATGYGGGGIDCAGFGNGTLMNCTFWNNVVTGGGQGGGMLVQGGAAGNNLKVTNCIFYANNALTGTSAGGAQGNSGTVTASFTLFGSASLDAVFADGGNNLIGANPGFSNTSSLAGNDGIYGTADDGLTLTSGSVALDSGTASGAPLTDISGHGRPQGTGFDMGAYELAVTVYVTTAGVSTNNGLSWGAPQDLATAMSHALSGEQIWVAAGSYSPGATTTSTFAMTPGVSVYGGFAGGEGNFSQRNLALNQAVLSGGGVNYHVVTGANNSTLDGFVITGGNAVGTGIDFGGGGLLCNNTAPTVVGCVFKGNNASSDGGAVYIHNSGATPTFKNCVFAANTSGNNGGAIEIEDNATSTFTNCTFSGNTSSPNRGGAFELFSGCVVNLVGCVLWGDTQSEVFINTFAPVPQLTATSCDIQGGLPSGATDGGGNIYTDPQFVNTGSLAGANGTFLNGDDGLMLSGSSPALNAGAPGGATTDIIGFPRPLGTAGDIGAYETPYVSVTASIPTVAKPALSGTTASFGQFTFTRNGDTSVPMTLNVTIGGSAVPGADYLPITTPISFTGGQASVSVPVNIIPTSQAGNPVTVLLTLNPSVPGAPAGYGCLPVSTATVTITNLNTAGVVLVPVGPYSPTSQPNILYTNQGGTTATFTVQLNSKPAAGVTVNLTSSNSLEGSVSPSSVSFTTGNWNTPVTVTVNGVNDYIARGAPVPYGILTSGAISSDTFYNRNITVLPSAIQSSYATGMPFVAQSGNNWQVKVDGTPRATSSFAVSNVAGLATVVLNAPLPTSGDNVQIQYLGEETFAVNGSTVYPLVTTFPYVLDKSNSWVVSVTTGAGTSVLPCNGYTIAPIGGLGGISLNSTVGVTSVLVQTDVAAAVNDNHYTKGVTVVPAGGVSVTEGGVTAHYTVVLNSQPSGGSVVINLAGSLTNLFANVPSLTFTPTFNQAVSGTTSGWNIPQTVTVSASRDFLIENPNPYAGQINQTLVGTGTDYAGVVAPNVPVTITDVDVAAVVFTPSTGLQTSTAGTTTTFTVQLSSIPTGPNPVNVTLHSSNTGYGTINGATGNALTLTFTPGTGGDWNVPQTVTITGGTLNSGAGPVGYSISMDAPTSTSDANYNAIAANPTAVSLTNTDAAQAGVIIIQNGQLSVTKGGASKTFQVQLSKDPTQGTAGAPGDSVVVSFSAVSNLVSISPTSVVFTGSTPPSSTEWNNPVTLTVSALADNIVVAKTQIDQIVYAVVSNNTAYNGLTNQTNPIPVTVRDNNAPGLSITPTAGLVTTESGGVAGFQVGLLSRPVAGTTVNATLTSSNLGAGILAQQFYSASTTASTISFPGADNLTAVQPGMLVQVAGLGPNSGAITLVTAVDAVAGTVSVNPALTAYSGVETYYFEPSTAIANGSSTGTTVVNFSGSPDLTSIFEGQAVLITGPVTQSSTVRYVDRVNSTVTLAAAIPTSGGSPETVYFSAGPLNLSWSSINWQEVQDVAVIGVHNLQVNGAISYTVLASASDTGDPHYNTSASASAATTDFDFPIAYATPFVLANWSVTQGGSPLTGFTITGNADNTTHVHFSAAVAGTGTVTLTYLPTSLSYTESTALTDFDFAIPFIADNGPNWSVTEGGVALGNYTITSNAGFAHLSFSAPVATGTLILSYLPTVSLTNLNIDSAGFVVSPPTASTLFAGGSPSSATFTIHLTSEPVAPVTVQIQSSNSAKGTVSPASLTFTPNTPNGGLGWDQPQTVTVTAVGSNLADGAVPFTITMLPASSADPNYNTLVAPAVNMVTVDPDLAGIVIAPASSQSSATTTLVTNPQHTPSPTTATFTVVLTSQPLATVTVPLSSSNPAKGMPSPASLVFTPANWNSPQTVTVSGIANPIVQGTVPYQIVFAQPQTTDPSYAVLGVLPVNVNGQDNNSAGFVLSDPNSQSGHIFAFPPVGTDPNLLTTDLGGSTEFQVALTSQPSSGTVTVNLASTNTALGMPSPAILTFNATNWGQPQVVTVTGGNANNTDADGSYQIVFSSVVGPVEYSGLTTFSFSGTSYPYAVPLTNVAQNKTPTLSPITNLTVLETNVALASQPVQLVNLSGITTGQTAEINVLSVSAVSDNPTLIPDPVVTYNPGSLSPPPATGTLGFQQGVQQNGVANITVTVTSVDTSTPPPPYSSPNPWRGGTKSVSQVFSITVTPVNQQPTFTGGAPQSLLEQVGALVVPQSVASWATAVSAGAANETSQQLTFLCTNDNNALFSVQPTITYVPPASGGTTATLGTGTLSYTLASTAFGTANVTVVLMDSGGTANGGINASAPFIFQIVVTPVNQPPTLAVGADVAVEEGAPPQTFSGWATNITAGPPDQSAETLTITVSNDNNGLFTAGGQPAIDHSGNLTFTPKPEILNTAAPARGFTNVTVTVQNSGGTANGGQDTLITSFTITINPTNAVPVVAISDPATREVAIGANQIITPAMLSATDIDSTVRYPAADPGLIFTVQLVPGNGTLLLNGTPLAVGGTFLQSDIAAGNLSYTHNGGTSSSDGFAFTVTDEAIPEGSILASPPLPSTSTPGADASGNLPAATSALQVFTIIIDRTNPVVALLPTAPLAFTDQGAPELMAPLSTVSDSVTIPVGAPLGASAFTSIGGQSGTITASFASGDSGADVIGIDTSGAFTLTGAGNTIIDYSGATFGTLDITHDLNGGTILTVTNLTNLADVPTVQAFIRSLTFQNTAISPSNPYTNPTTPRVVQVQVTDIDSDPSSLGPIAQRTINVTAVPHTLVFSSPMQYITQENTPISGSVAATDVDVGQTVAYSVTASTFGTVTAFNAASGAFTFTPTANTIGTGSFTVQATDGHAGTAITQVVTVIITGVDLRPAGPLAFQDQGPAEFLAPTSTVVDPASFVGGQIQVSFSAGGTANDVISINTTGLFTLNGGIVQFNTGSGPLVQFGTFTSTPTASGTVLSVTGLTTYATAASVAAFISNLDYQNTAVSPSNPYSLPPTTNHVVQVVVSDAVQSLPPAQLTVAVTSLPHTPVFTSPTQYITLENAPLAGQLVATDVDTGQTLTYVLVVGSPTLGAVTALDGATGAFTFTPQANAIGPGGFTVQVTDGHGGTITQAISVTIIGVNLLPAGPLAFQDQGAPEFLAATSSVVDPASFVGGQIQVSFSAGGTANDVISINTAGQFSVSGQNVSYGGLPFGTAVATPTASGTVLSVTGLTANADAASVAAFISNLDYQNTAVSPSNPYSVPPTTNHVVQVAVSDAVQSLPPAQLTVTVTSLAHLPTFSPPTQYTTAENTPLTGQVVAVDVDLGQTLTYSVTGATLGTVTAFNPATGAFTFTPQANTTGTGSFTVQVTDGHQTTSQTFSVFIPGVVLLPAGPLSYIDQAPPEFIAPTSTVTDPAGFAGGQIVASFFSGGTINDVISIGTTGLFTLNGNAVYYNTGSGPAQQFGIVSYTQGNAGTVLTVASLTSLATTPVVAAFISDLQFQNTAVSPSDPYANPLTSCVVQVVVTDALNDVSSPAMRTIDISSKPHTPTFSPPTQFSTPENVALSAQVVAVDVDLGQTLTYSVIGSPSLGTVTAFNPATGAFTFTPTANTTGVGGFTVQVTDGKLETTSQPISIFISGVVLLPAGPLGFTDQGPPEFIAPTSSVTDAAGFQGGQIVASFSAGGTINDVISISTTGQFTVSGSNILYGGAQFGTFTAPPGPSGTVLTVTNLTALATTPAVAAFISNLEYQNTAVSPSDPYADTVTSRTVQVVVTDAAAVVSTPAQLTIAVTSVPHAPTFTSPTTYVTAENIPLSGQVVAVDVDLGQTLTYSVVGTPTLGTVVINPITGAFTYTPVANTLGNGSFTVQVTDGQAETVTQVINAIIASDNPLEPFVTSNPPLETQQGDTVIYNVVGYSPGTAAPTFTVVGLAAGTYTLTVSGQTATLTLLSTATATAGYVTFGILITDTINNLSGFQPVTLLVDPTPAAGG